MILAGVSINAILGDNGIIKKAQESANLTKESEAKEIMNRAVLEYYLVKDEETFEDFLQSKVPDTIDSVTKNEDGTFTISKNGYTLTVEDKSGNSSDNDKRMEGELTLSEYSGEYVYPNSGTFSITKSTGTVSVESSNENIAKVEINDNIVTVIPGITEGSARIIVTSASNEEYKEKTAIYEATIMNGEIELSATPYSGMYDGQTHKALTSVSVIPSDANKEYSIDGENYNETIPTISEISKITVYVRASKIGYQTKTITCTAQVEDNTFNEESGVGYYADTDGDGTVDGIIFADLQKGGSGKWGGQSYTITKSTGFKEYYISQTNYKGKSVLATKKTGTGNERFYVMALNDYSSNTYTFANAQIKSGAWSTPSIEKWRIYGGELGINKTNYGNYGLQGKYWSSSDINNMFNFGCYADFSAGTTDDNGKSQTYYVRLSRTF